MLKPVIPHDENKRLAALEDLRILDTVPEERFDRYTRLARRLFEVPIALVSLVDANRQWFKSKQGLDASETPRDISFCGHAIADDDVFVIENATDDRRFADNPLVTSGPKIRFYAGCPLATPSGHKLGTLCIIDQVPRRFPQEDIESLRDMGAMVAGELAALKLATMDELTGLANRRGFSALARHAIATCDRSREPAALVMIDLDDFKFINDTLGHATGDAALAEFSDLMTETFRDSDICARLGGDEFCALLLGSSAADAETAMRRLGNSVRVRNRRRDSSYPLAFSAGVVDYCPSRHEDIGGLLGEADELMYERKSRKTS